VNSVRRNTTAKEECDPVDCALCAIRVYPFWATGRAPAPLATAAGLGALAIHPHEVFPEHKFHIVDVLQQRSQRVELSFLQEAAAPGNRNAC
jgi:hypothetical protein